MDDLVKPHGWLLIKRGLYWRPEGQGYTGLKREAGRYDLAEAKAWTDYHTEITRVHEDEAPEFSSSCYSDTKDKLAKEQATRITALEAALKPFADKAKKLDDAKKLFEPDYDQTRSILFAGEEAYSRAKAALEDK